MKIEWDSDHADGRRRRPKASTVHGWLAKMRGTLIGDESLRSRGMREMQEARVVRAYTKAKKAQRSSSHRHDRHSNGGGVLSLFGGKKKSSPSRRSGGIIVSGDGQRSRHHTASHRLVGYVTHKQDRISTSRGSTSNKRHTHQSSSRGTRHKR